MRQLLFPLISRRAINRFRSFNYHTARTCSSTSSSPWLMLPPSFQESVGMKYNFYIPAENKLVSFNKKDHHVSEAEVPDDKSEIVGSSHGWLALFNPADNNNLDLFLSNPLTRRHIKLPSINSLDIPIEYKQQGLVTKLILSCDDPESPDCRALMSFGPRSRLAFCSPLTSTHWTPLGCAKAGIYEDFFYDSWRNRFYCISHGEIQGWDIADSDQDQQQQQRPRMDWALNKGTMDCNLPWGLDWDEQFYYVIAYSDQLYLVCRDYIGEMTPDGTPVRPSDDYRYETVGFYVYKIDRERQKLSFMEGGSLDGLIMFVGLNHSFALPASEHPGLKRNSIYFTDIHKLTPTSFMDSTHGGHDIGIFDFGKKKISPCYYPCDEQSFKRIMPAPLWFTPTFNSLPN